MGRNLTYDTRSNELPEDIFGPSPRLRFSYGTDDRQKAREIREQTIDLLRDWGEWEILKACQERELTIQKVHDRLQEASTPPEQAEAISELRAAAAGVAERRTPTLREIWDDFEDDAGLNDETMRGYDSTRKTVLTQTVGEGEQELGDLPVDEITSMELDQALKATGNAGSTQELKRQQLQRVFSWFAEREMELRRKGYEPRLRPEDNPAANVEKRDQFPRVNALEDEQIRELLSEAEPYQRAYLRMLVHLGIRIGELIHVRYGTDLDTDDWRLQIQTREAHESCGCSSCQHGDGEGWCPKGRSRHPKKNRSIRTLVIPERPTGLRQDVEAYLKLHPPEYGDFAFRNPRTDEVWHPQTLRRDLSRLVDRCDSVEYGSDTAGGLTPHTLRHTAATAMLRNGVPESIVARVLGDTVDTVVETYINLDPEDTATGISRTPEYAPGLGAGDAGQETQSDPAGDPAQSMETARTH